MEYVLETCGRTVEAVVATGAEGGTTVEIGARSLALAVDRISDHEIMMTVDGRQVQAWVAEDADGKTIILNGRYFRVTDLDAAAGPSGGPAVQEEGALTPPMPAVVIGVPKAEGDEVEKGETIILLSAMKMEAYITAPYSGRITAIRVAKGDKVMPGDILADIEKAQEE